MHDNKFNWGLIIPIAFCVICVGISIGKLAQSGRPVHIIDYLDIVNSSIFSTFISMVIGMAYQFFAHTEIEEKIKSGLDPKWMWLTIVSTIGYGTIAIINACRFCLLTSILMFFASVGYVFVFFKYMRNRV